VPSVVCASKSGAVSPIVSAITTSFEATLTVASKASQTNDQKISLQATPVA
jgi:hypothetical protein